jgi:hypothetical protein
LILELISKIIITNSGNGARSFILLTAVVKERAFFWG